VTSPATGSVSQETSQLLGNLRFVTKEGVTRDQPAQHPRSKITMHGYLRNLGAPPSHFFPVTIVVPGKPEETARNFLKEYAHAFGTISAAVDFRALRSRSKDNRIFVRLK
jgi:hypothetical protein